jgi:hypothetical protein
MQDLPTNLYFTRNGSQSSFTKNERGVCRAENHINIQRRERENKNFCFSNTWVKNSQNVLKKIRKIIVTTTVCFIDLGKLN